MPTPILEYCTQIIGKTKQRLIGTCIVCLQQVTAPFMTNDEEEVEFEINHWHSGKGLPVLTELLPYI